MSRPTVTNHDVATGEVTEREMNNEEYAEWESRLAQTEAAKAAEAAKAVQRQAVYDKLGLKADEVAALFA